MLPMDRTAPAGRRTGRARPARQTPGRCYSLPPGAASARRVAGTDVLRLSDDAVVGAYLLCILVLGLRGARARTSSSEYFLASRHASWPVIGLALIGSNLSPGALIGITGSAYALGISVYNYDWVATITLVVFALWLLPMLLAQRIYTVPEYLERRYDRRARTWLASLSIVLYVLLDAAGALYCAALVLHALIPRLSFLEAIPPLAVFAALYALTGGLRAVMRTQALQGVVMLGSAAVLAWYALEHAGGWQAVVRANPAQHLHLILPASDPYMPWTGLAFGAPVLALYYWCSNQVIVQRTLAARSVADGQRGALLAGVLKLSTLALIVAPGLAGRVLFPHLHRDDDIYIRLALGLLPAGLIGVFLAAFLGALMAALSATYNSAATVLSIDFIRRARPQLDERQTVRWGRIGTALAMLASAAWVPQIARFPSLWQYFQAVLAYLTPPVAAVFLGGLLWRGANARGAFAALTAGTALGVGLFVLELLGRAPLQFLDVAGVTFAVSLLTLGLVSLSAPPQLSAAPSPAAQRTPRSVQIAGLAVLALTAAVVAAFW